ncbi:uncharacterized protein LOC114675567 [Macaca mulatta]
MAGSERAGTRGAKGRGGAGRGPRRGAARTHPEKAHFELPYSHHVLAAGQGRGSAASSGAAAPAPCRLLPPRLLARAARGRNRRRCYFWAAGPAALGHVAAGRLLPGASGPASPAPSSQERPRTASATRDLRRRRRVASALGPAPREPGSPGALPHPPLPAPPGRRARVGRTGPARWRPGPTARGSLEMPF